MKLVDKVYVMRTLTNIMFTYAQGAMRNIIKLSPFTKLGKGDYKFGKGR